MLRLLAVISVLATSCNSSSDKSHLREELPTSPEKLISCALASTISDAEATQYFPLGEYDDVVFSGEVAVEELIYTFSMSSSQAGALDIVVDEHMLFEDEVASMSAPIPADHHLGPFFSKELSDSDGIWGQISCEIKFEESRPTNLLIDFEENSLIPDDVQRYMSEVISAYCDTVNFLYSTTHEEAAFGTENDTDVFHAALAVGEDYAGDTFISVSRHGINDFATDDLACPQRIEQ